MTNQRKTPATIAAEAIQAEKRAEALRQNLARRKEQAREREPHTRNQTKEA